MKLKKIETETEYEAALAYAESLMDALPDSPEEDDLKTIVLLIEAYEDENFPIGLPDPIAEEGSNEWADMPLAAELRADLTADIPREPL